MKSNRKIIDIHTHIFPKPLAARAVQNIGTYYSINMQCEGTSENLLQSIEELPNIRFVISSATLKYANLRNGNDFLLDEAQKHKEFIPFSSFYPFMNVTEAKNELLRVKALGTKGIKLHPDFQKFCIDDQNAIEIYKICEELGLPILFHVGDENTDMSSPTRIYRVAEKLPGLKIIAAHLCGYKAWDEAERTIIGTSVYTEISDALSCLSPERVVDLIRRHGVDKVMFGSDFPLLSPAKSFETFDKLAFSEDEKDMIYYKTAEKLFSLN
ncbi:MAG: amidohydrolase family protein [Clostridia bacterium]